MEACTIPENNSNTGQPIRVWANSCMGQNIVTHAWFYAPINCKSSLPLYGDNRGFHPIFLSNSEAAFHVKSPLKP